MSNLNQDIYELLKSGADIVGFADLSKVHEGMPFGISVAMAIDPQIVKGIHDGPTLEYVSEYHRLNKALNELVLAGAKFLESKGYEAYAQTTDVVKYGESLRTPLPHKTVATRAGLGWIGKCALLVTEKYGAAIRISSLITNAPLDCAEPVDKSRCGDCRVCVESCLGNAASGKEWYAGIDREAFFDAHKCSDAIRAIEKRNEGTGLTLCGKCIEVCPYTQKYLNQ